MPPSPDTSSWELDGPHGRERWVGVPGSFDHVLLDGEPVTLNPADGELHLLRPRASTCIHPGPFPFAFRFCPACGAHLQPPMPEPGAESWSTPASASGLPAPSCHGVPDPASRTAISLPGPAQFDLFVAGTPPRLLAYDQGSGRVHALIDGAGLVEAGWRDLVQLPTGSGLPRWAWGIAAFADGAAVPGDRGPVFLQLGPRHSRVIEAVDGGAARCLGGAASVGTLALVPVLTTQGVAVAVAGPPERDWRLVPVAGAPADEVFAAASLRATEAMWVGRRGQLFVRVQDDEVFCDFRPWGAGWEPMQAVRPVLSPNGVFHQLGRVEGRQVFEALVPPGATPQRLVFDRYLTSIGGISFMGAARFREPWEPKRTEYRGGENTFFLPLLGFDRDRVLVAACSPRTSLRSFTETGPEVEEALECRVLFADASIVPAALGVTIRARSAWEVAALVYRRTLLVHDVRGNRAWAWSLSDV